jgi:hypothetical protein
VSGISIAVNDTVTPALKRRTLRLSDARARHRAMAEAALPFFQRRFVALASSNRNAFGARSTFWNRMLSGTRATSTLLEAVVSMPREVALRYFGGTVTPKGSKYLTIPARKEYYGKSARQFSDLRFAMIGNRMALVQADSQRVSFKGGKVTRGRKTGGAVAYWLVPRANIKGDRSILPSDAEIAERINTSLRRFLS